MKVILLPLFFYSSIKKLGLVNAEGNQEVLKSQTRTLELGKIPLFGVKFLQIARERLHDS
ncbi:MAG: hypothetical protein EAX86_06740 [Candidatus Heimdallarchaeota archaeon]|nr:hypothetical protein [Candidatus Heimdallarchaeota archaeon]